jgi:DNA repair photolyase
MVSQLSLFEEYTPMVPPAVVGRASVGVREQSKVLEKGGAQYLGCDYTLNPYVGCSFGCSYCYAAFFVADEALRQRWGEWVDVKLDAERQVASSDLRGAKILMSSATDPYQPLEAKLGMTRRLVEIMSEPGKQPLLREQTRSPLAERDIDLFNRFLDIRVNMSITTDSEEIRKRFEPHCASIERRMEAIERIGAYGIPIGISIAPTLPLEDPERFAKRLAKLNPVHVFCSQFHVARREFTAGTRPLALKIAQECSWDEHSYRRTVSILKKHLPIRSE